MKYLLVISLYILSGCNYSEKLVNFNKNNNKSENVSLSDSDFKKMSFDEFKFYLIEYSQNSDYPDINQ